MQDNDYPFGAPVDALPESAQKLDSPEQAMDRPQKRSKRQGEGKAPSKRDDMPSGMESVLLMHMVVLSGHNLALDEGQGARVWKYGSIFGASLVPCTIWALTAPVVTRSQEDGLREEFIMDPSSPMATIPMELLRNHTLSHQEMAVAQRYPMDARGMQLKVVSLDRTGVIPVFRGKGPGSSGALFCSDPLTPADFVARMPDNVQLGGAVELPGYYTPDPNGSYWLWDILKGKERRVRPIDVPFSLLPGDDFLTEAELEVLRSPAWESRLQRHLQKKFFSAVEDVFFGYGVPNPSHMITQEHTPQRRAACLRVSSFELLQRNPLAPLAGNARRVVAGVLGSQAPWEFEPSYQTPLQP